MIVHTVDIETGQVPQGIPAAAAATQIIIHQININKYFAYLSKIYINMHDYTLICTTHLIKGRVVFFM